MHAPVFGCTPPPLPRLCFPHTNISMCPQQVFTHVAVQPAVSAALLPGRRFLVLGSSCGWLPLYGTLAFGWEAAGVELLPWLVDVSQRIAAQAGAAHHGVPMSRSLVGWDFEGHRSCKMMTYGSPVLEQLQEHCRHVCTQ